MAIENGPFEDAFPIENGIFHCHVSLPEYTPKKNFTFSPEEGSFQKETASSKHEF